MFRKKEGNEGSNEPRVPDNLVDAVAIRFYEKYGVNLVEMLNSKVAQKIQPILDKVLAIERRVKYLEEQSDERVRSLLKATFEVGMETVSEKSAKKAIESLELDRRLDTLKIVAENLNQSQMELAEKIEDLSMTVRRIEVVIDNVKKISDNINGIINEAKRKVNEIVGMISEEVNEEVEKAVQTIDEKIMVDEQAVARIVEAKLRQIVEAKFGDIVMSMKELSSKVEALERRVEELKTIEDAVGRLHDEIKSIEEGVRELRVESPTPTGAEDELAQKAQEIKATQNIEEYSVE